MINTQHMSYWDILFSTGLYLGIGIRKLIEKYLARLIYKHKLILLYANVTGLPI